MTSDKTDVTSERRRPARAAKGRVEKVWRTVRWAESFPDEALGMDSVDLTPTFAGRKIAALCERKQFQDCAALVSRLNGFTLSAILSDLPGEKLHDALPASLPILEVLYQKVCQNTEQSLPTGQLMTDQLVKRLVIVFATESLTDTDRGGYLQSCKAIVRVILGVETNFRNIVAQRKSAIDKCLRNMGKHGLVDSSGGKLMTLHDALRVELEKGVIQYKCALQALDQVSGKHPVTASLSSGPAPSEGSHQRMMQVSRADVQDRIIKNKTLYNLAEPAVCGRYLRDMVALLGRRIDFDKVLLFHDTELRKMSDGAINSGSTHMSTTLRKFSHGYGTLLRIIDDVTGRTVEEKSDVSSDDEDDVLPLTSSLSILERMKVISVNGIIPLKKADNKSGGGGRVPLVNETRSRDLGRREGFVVTSSSSRVAGNGEVVPMVPATNGDHATTDNGSSGISAPIPLAVTNGQGTNNNAHTKSVALLEQEVRYLRDELTQSREQIRKLQEQEKQLRERLAGQIHRQFTTHPVSSLEDLSLGDQRPTALVRSYDSMYREGRVDTLDALDSLTELQGLDILKMKILFSVVVLSFRCAQQHFQDLRGRLRHLLCLPPPTTDAPTDPLAWDIEGHISNFLTRTTQTYDIGAIVHDVCGNIYATLYDYPGLKTCAGLADYTASVVRLAWALSVQQPPYTIAYDHRSFLPQYHVRFHTSDSDTDAIKSFLWPVLLDSQSGDCVAKGVVIT
ncbi:uncharacterized protein LOC101853203 [Aplysia californica]|uniref:Mitochondria-eating protein n=1 Tax=Aplysia californica TaxID=6500 RepID=A0ABM1ADL9_APLCA|nr:uncharacterized protein LOC101853203 [Aplysia californica]